MALVLADRVQETSTSVGTGSFTLAGAVTGYQTFAVIGNGNTTFYTIADQGGSNWEVGIGTYSTTGPTLARTTVLSNSNGNTSPVNFPAGTKTVFVTYPSEQSVNLDASGNVSALGTIASGVWQGSTIGVAYGGTGVTSSSGANSVVLRDANQNISVNRVNQANTNTTASGGTTALTAASSYIHSLVGTGGQTYTLPDATTLTTGVAFVFNNLATGTLTIQDYATATIGTIPSGGAGAVFLTNNGTVGGTWDLHAYLPEGVTFGTNAFNLGSAVISGGTWQGGTIQPAYGGTGLTTFTGANNALYSTGSTTLTAGTLPVPAGGTGITSATANGLVYGNGTSALQITAAGTTGQVLLGNTGSAPSWGSVPAGSITGTLPIANGGTGQTTAGAAFNALSPITTTGDLIVGNGSNSATRLGIGSTGQVLTVSGGTATWVTPTTGGGTITRTDFTATGGQTIFTVSYTVGLIDVYRNGVKLATTDFTATNGTSFTLAVAANAGDIVQAVVFSSLNLYSTITYQVFNGDGTTTVFTMSSVPANSASLLVAISGVVQDPGTYTVSSTTLTFLTAPPAGTGNISVRYLGIASVGTVGSFSAGTTGLTPSSATTGAVVLAGTLNVANGGTGVTTSTGSGNNVLSASPTFTGTVVAPTINAGAATALTLQSAGTTAITVDTSQNVGIGKSSYSSMTTDGVWFEKGTYNQISNTSNGNATLFLNQNGTGAMQEWRLANAVKGTFNQYGLGLGTAVPSSGVGITFPATQSASSDANCLDDYEEGTWTPALAGSSTNPSVTYSFQIGRYTKIGNRVLFNMQLIVTAVAGQGTGIINITGLPFAAAGNAYENICPIGYNDVFDTAFPSAYANSVTLTVIPTGVTQANASWGSPATGSVSPVSTGYLAITGSYNVA